MTQSPFPDLRWGRDIPVLHKLVVGFASSSLGSLLIRKAAPLDRRVLEKTRGRRTVLGPLGLPVMLLVSTGAKSGAQRISPLLYYREDPHLYLVGSNFGGDRHPGWSYNLLAGGPAAVRMGRDIPVTAELLGGAERQRILDAFIAFADNYRVYLGRTNRDLRVFKLTA